MNVYLLKKTVRERKDSSPSPELALAKTTPVKKNVKRKKERKMKSIINSSVLIRLQEM